MLNHKAMIGYGYIIDNEYPEYPEDGNDTEYFEHMAEIFDSPYCHTLNDGEEPTFFGITIEDTGHNCFCALDSNFLDDCNDFMTCASEFHRLFPHSELEPQLYLLSKFY